MLPSLNKVDNKQVGNQWLIPYPWKKDPKGLPDDKLQGIKRLEATEKRLNANLKHAEAYNHQLKEMNEMKFARKVSEEEMKQYKGPVHYISHHEVIRLE